MIIFFIPSSLIYGMDYWTTTEPAAGFWDVLFQYVAPLFITVWFWVKYMGTPGKMVLRLRVLDAHTGQPISTGKAFGRYLAYYVSILPFMLGVIWVGIDKKKQGWHDKLAGTVVVRELSPESVTFE